MSTAQHEVLLSLGQILEQRLPGETALRHELMHMAESVTGRANDADALDLFQLVSRMVDLLWLRDRLQPPARLQRDASALDHLQSALGQLRSLPDNPSNRDYGSDIAQLTARLRWDLTLSRLDWLAQQVDLHLGSRARDEHDTLSTAD